MQFGTNKAMIGAIRRGMRDFDSGLTLADCPYEDKRKADGRLSWSRAFMTAWRDGWQFRKSLIEDPKYSEFFDEWFDFIHRKGKLPQ